MTDLEKSIYERLSDSAKITINYLEKIDCEIEFAEMKKTIPEFGYLNKQDVIAIDKHVMTVNQFEEFSGQWYKIIAPRINEMG